MYARSIIIAILIISISTPLFSYKIVSIESGEELQEHVSSMKEPVLYLINVPITINNIIIPNYSDLQFSSGASIETKGVLTINGKIHADKSRIFYGPGKIKFGNVVKFDVLPQWWGAKGDFNGVNGTDNLPSLKSAVDSLPEQGGTVRLSGMKNTWISDSWNITKSNVKIIIDEDSSLTCNKQTSAGHTIGFVHPGLLRRKKDISSQLSNVHITGGGSVYNSSPGNNENAIGFGCVNDFSCTNMKITKCNKKAITAQVNVSNGLIANNTIGLTGHDAITIEGDSVEGKFITKNIRVENNLIEHAGKSGIFCTYAKGNNKIQNITISNNIIKFADKGIVLSNAFDIHVASNKIKASNIGIDYFMTSEINDLNNIFSQDTPTFISLNKCYGHILISGFDTSNLSGIDLRRKLIINSMLSDIFIKMDKVKYYLDMSFISITNKANFKVYLIDNISNITTTL